jgi:hypothetical protein
MRKRKRKRQDHRGPVPAPSIPLGHSQAMWKPSYSQGDAGRGAELITSLCKRKALSLAGRAPSTTGESMSGPSGEQEAH